MDIVSLPHTTHFHRAGGTGSSMAEHVKKHAGHFRARLTRIFSLAATGAAFLFVTAIIFGLL